MFYIHHTACISPQQTFVKSDLETLHGTSEYKLMVKEPIYEGIPPSILRRMGKAVRIGVGAALPLLKENVDGIIIGTANGGMEDCIKFLNQMVQYDEGTLTPGNFVQSTPNAIAAQIGLLKSNKGYNTTHVHRGLSFENAMMDADMLLEEDHSKVFLLGAVDEISTYNYNIDRLAGFYKQENFSGTELYGSKTPGSVAGEGAAMFIVNGKKENAIAKVSEIKIIHSVNEEEVKTRFKDFTSNKKIDLLLSGENGDSRFLKFYQNCEPQLIPGTTICRYKHMTGEYPTTTGAALWLACELLRTQKIPAHIIKRAGDIHLKARQEKQIENILICNNYKGEQHSFILVSTDP